MAPITSFTLSPLSTSSHTLHRRTYCASDSYDSCNPHRIIVGAIIGIVFFFVFSLTCFLCTRARKRNLAREQATKQRRGAFGRKLEMEHTAPGNVVGGGTGGETVPVEMAMPPPAYTRVDARGV